MRKYANRTIIFYSSYVIGCLWIILHLLPKNGLLQSFWPFTLSDFSKSALFLPGLLLSLISIAIPSKYFQSYDTLTLNKTTYLWILRGLSVFFLSFLCLYSIGHNFFGDGNLIKALTGASVDKHFIFGQQNIKPLISLLSSYTDWSTEITFRILSIIGGILYFLGLYIVVKDIKNYIAGIITISIFSTQPFILFFSNYIETYPLLAGFFFFYLTLSIKLNNNLKNNVILTVLLILLIFLHPLFGFVY